MAPAATSTAEEGPNLAQLEIMANEVLGHAFS